MVYEYLVSPIMKFARLEEWSIRRIMFVKLGAK